MANLDFEKFVREHQMKLIFLAAVLILGLLAYPEDVEGDLRLDSSTELKYIEDNQIGSIFVQRQTASPEIIEYPKYRACIYSSTGNPPVIVDVESDDWKLANNRVEQSKLEISIPESKLDSEFSQNELNITEMIDVL